jgi:hypothetical protein
MIKDSSCGITARGPGARRGVENARRGVENARAAGLRCDVVEGRKTDDITIAPEKIIRKTTI